jgi:hypothetical protein
VHTISELRRQLATAAAAVLELPPGVLWLGGAELEIVSNVTLRGAAEGSELDGENASRVLLVTSGAHLVLRGVTLTRGNGYGSGGSGPGGALLVLNGADAIVHHGLISASTAMEGGGVFVYRGRLQLIATRVVDCTAQSAQASGGGVQITHGSLSMIDTTLTRCGASSSTSARGGGLAAQGATVALQGINVTECYALAGAGTLGWDANGGGVYVSHCSLLVEDAHVSRSDKKGEFELSERRSLHLYPCLPHQPLLLRFQPCCATAAPRPQTQARRTVAGSPSS